ncbi:unnamed protein product [Schistosoma turkestanicum]|nr:unnamed protein product [Schistosoma turkestanicum]
MSIIHLVIMCTVSMLSFADGDITTTTATTTVTLNDSVNIAQPHFNCNLTQHGFHLRLHCDFYDFSMDLLKSCQLHVNLPSGFFIDPFELKSNQPELKFSIHKSNDAAAIQQKLPNSIKKLVNWFAYSKIKQKKTIDHSHENDQSLYQNNIVDIEAPEWLAQPLTFKFHISQLDQLKWGIDQLLIDLSSLDSDWYHPSLSKLETDKIFSNCSTIKDGAFLIRRSSQSERKFVLVLYYQHQTLKYQIEVVDFSFHLDTKEAYFIDKGPLHLSLEHLVEHYSRFADGIPVRLHYAISPSGRITNIEQLMPHNLDNHGRELRKIESSSTLGNDAWALRTISSSLHGGRMGAPLSLSTVVKGASRHGQKSKNQAKHHNSSSSSGVSGMSSSGGGLLPVAAGLQLTASGSACLGSTSGSGELRLIPSDAVILLYRLGEGEFGEVYRGRLHLDNGIIQEVAVKVLVQPSQRLDFLKEATIMMQLSHPHIITIYGVCENKRLMMILELAELGSLLDYLLDYPEKCQLPELYNWSMQIASGMSFLESARFVHRDLACRNVLLSNHSCAKISDFGLSRAVGVESDYYKATQRGKWPVKWYAPESIYYKTFSHASDVWSFGICLWEMFSLGEHPYADQDSFEVLRQIEEGVRLPRPHLANDDVFAIMHDCWAYNPDARPTFAQLLAVFQHLATNVYENVEPPELVVSPSCAQPPPNKANPSSKIVKNGIPCHNSNNSSNNNNHNHTNNTICSPTTTASHVNTTTTNSSSSSTTATTTAAAAAVMVTNASSNHIDHQHLSGNDRRHINCTNNNNLLRVSNTVNTNGLA